MSVFLLTFKPFSRRANPALLALSEQVKTLPLLLNDAPVGSLSSRAVNWNFYFHFFFFYQGAFSASQEGNAFEEADAANAGGAHRAAA